MARFLHRSNSAAVCNPQHVLLAFFWISGILSGIHLYGLSGISFLSWMRSNLGAVSIVSLTLVTLFPFLLSAFAVSVSGRWLIFPLAFLKGNSFSFVSVGLLCSFGSAGWIIRLLLCFSDVVSLPLLYWFWLRCLRKDTREPGLDAVLLCSLVFLIGSVDYCLVSPFMAMLINL